MCVCIHVCQVQVYLSLYTYESVCECLCTPARVLMSLCSVCLGTCNRVREGSSILHIVVVFFVYLPRCMNLLLDCVIAFVCLCVLVCASQASEMQETTSVLWRRYC